VNAPQRCVTRTLPVFLSSLFEGFFIVFKRTVAFTDGVLPSAFLGVEPQNIIFVMQTRLLF
jgi:hypothetical protein